MHRFFTRSARSSALALAVFAATAAPAFAQPPANERTAAAVILVEHHWLAALNRHDVTALARILGQEFIDSDFQGDAITRARYLAYFEQPLSRPAPRVQQIFADTKVRFIAGGEVAIVTGVVVTRPEVESQTGSSSSSGGIRHSRFTDVFVWRAARWQAVTGQETHFAPSTS